MVASAPLILAFGDSLVAGYGLPSADGFAAQLVLRLSPAHPGVPVVNAGAAGDTTADALRRLPRVLSRLDRRPDLAIVQVGPNDLLRQLPPSLTGANLDAILIEFDRCNVPVLLTTVAPPAFLRHRADAYSGIHGDLAAGHPGVTLSPFFPPGVLGHRAMVLADRVHPNAKAIAAVVEAMIPAAMRAIAVP